jgi:hypothetical protein
VQSWTLEGELKRLVHGPSESDAVPGLGTVRFIVHCRGNAGDVLKLVKSVMKLIASLTVEQWDANGDLNRLLPQEFVGAFATDMTPEEAENWFRRWQKLTEQQQRDEELNRIWSFSNWLYWLSPDKRSWCWWDAIEVDKDHLLVAVAAKDWPFPWGSLAWLFRGSGALMVEPEPDYAST